MKKTKAGQLLLRLWVTAALLIALLLPGAFAEQAQTTAALYLNPDKARPVYAQPGGQGDLVGELAQGEAFELLTETGGWAQILRYNAAGHRVPGWTEAAGLRRKTAEDAPSFALVNSPDPALRAPLHTGASGKSKVLGKYYNGVAAIVLQAAKDEWVKLGIGSLEGFMRVEFLAMDAPPGSLPSYIPSVQVNNPRDPGLTLRAGQSYQSDKLGGYSNGASVQVLGVTEEFAHVITQDGKIGFMMASGLSPQPIYADVDPGVYVAQPEGALSVIDNPGGQGAHLRQKASTGSASLGLYPNGTQVVVTGGTDWWKQVWVEGRTGYMMAKLIRGFEPSEDAPEDTWLP